MSHPIRENLELYKTGDNTVIRCTKCGHVYCNRDEDWMSKARKLRLPPTAGGPPMAILNGKFFLEQVVCPSCYVLLETKVIERELLR